MSQGQTPSAKKPGYLAGILFLTVLLGSFYALRVVGDNSFVDEWWPKWTTFATLAAMFVLERVLARQAFVSQRPMLVRDIVSTLINVYLTAAVTGFLLLPVFLALSEFAFGRAKVFASPEQLGPMWLQAVTVFISVSLFRYWMHRWQHSNEFLWKLHSYHHRVTDLQATNTFVSHPIDYALRNAVVFILLGLIGFAPLALLVALPAMSVLGVFSHFGGEVKAGFLNKWFVTPEVHRWHHTANVPEGHKYSVNYGVEFSFWDRLFGTYYLPQTGAHPEPPERIGHPDGLADESNYIRLLLAPLGLYRPWPRLRRSASPQRPADN